MISLATFLQYKGGQLGGVVGLSGANCTHIKWDTIDIELKKKTKMFLYHGAADTLIPFQVAVKSYE